MLASQQPEGKFESFTLWGVADAGGGAWAVDHPYARLADRQRDHFLAEILRLADANGGVPLGRARFEQEMGIRELDWLGRYWTRSNDVVVRAGYPATNSVGLGAYEACRPWAEGVDTGFKAPLYISGRDVGAAAAEALAANIVDGTPLPELTVADTEIVYPDTYADVMTCT